MRENRLSRKNIVVINIGMDLAAPGVQADL